MSDQPPDPPEPVDPRRPPEPPGPPVPPEGEPAEPSEGTRPFPPTPGEHQAGRGSIWLGIGIAVIAAASVWLVPFFGVTDGRQLTVFLTLLLGVPVALLVAGIVLAVIPRTRRTGSGLLIALGAAVLITGGVCTALLTSWSA
ncbi:hypothetical protein [Agromyces sp. ZXT2-3]|uniref:hypothetical protein n=1 Tax=Agromyces sp. ZXT2-3 TaxID=3461152 RepID=UPI0040551631